MPASMMNKQLKSSVLPGLPDGKDRPVGQEGRCSLVVCSSPWPRKEFDWNGDVATRVDMRTTKVKFFKKYLSEGMSDPGKIIRPGR